MSKRLEHIQDEEIWKFLLDIKGTIKMEDIPFVNLRTSLEQTNPGSIVFYFTNGSTNDYLVRIRHLEVAHNISCRPHG